MANYRYMMSAEDIAKELNCSKSHAYKIVKELNRELAGQGYITMAGRIPRAFWAKKMYGYELSISQGKGRGGMAYKEKDTKKWSAQWFETTAKGEKKKRRKRGFETKREALEYERQKKLSSSRSMDMKLSEFMEIYFEDKQNELKDRTMKNKRYMMEQHIIPYFGEQMLSEITASQIIQWQNEMQTKGFSESYLRMIQNQLTCIFTHASRIYDLHTNPCKKVKRMGNSDSRSLDFWTTEEYQRFIQTIEPGTRYYLIFEILFWTGCRIGELLALTKGDISIENNQISITKTFYRTGR